MKLLKTKRNKAMIASLSFMVPLPVAERAFLYEAPP
jgi:hypothetical protein